MQPPTKGCAVAGTGRRAVELAPRVDPVAADVVVVGGCVVVAGAVVVVAGAVVVVSTVVEEIVDVGAVVTVVVVVVGTSAAAGAASRHANSATMPLVCACAGTADTFHARRLLIATLTLPRVGMRLFPSDFWSA